jgi:CRP-like cAMP-binding protein
MRNACRPNPMTPNQKIKALISNFKLLNKKEVAIIVEKTIAAEFEKGTLLLKEGQIPTKCYMVVEGCVREYIIKDGEEKSTAFFTEGDTFTPQARDGKPSKYYWECAEDCTLTISDKNYEEEIRAALPRLDAVFQEIAIEKINKAKEEWTLFVTSSPEERYLNLLNTNPQLLTRVPQHQIASHLGIKPQSLSRIRKRLLDKKP